MLLNPQSEVFDRALILIIALMSVLGLLTLVLPVSKPQHGGPSDVQSDMSGIKSQGKVAAEAGAAGTGGSRSSASTSEVAVKDRLTPTPNRNGGGGLQAISSSVFAAFLGANPQVGRLVSLQVRHELERVGKLVVEAESGLTMTQSWQENGVGVVELRRPPRQSLRLLRGLVRRIALGEGRQAMIADFQRDADRLAWVDPEAARNHSGNISERAKDHRQQRVNAWLRRLAGWAAKEGDRDGYLREARSAYFHAMGLSNTGQHLDAYLEFALSLEGFRRFIERNPLDARVPESLYLLGVAFLNLRELLPPSVMGERFLMMCTDFFGETVWGSRARQLWAPARGGDPRERSERRNRHAL